MNTCHDLNKDRLAFLSGELDGEKSERIASHLKKCSKCRTEIEEARKIIDAAGLMKEDVQQALSSVDWEALPQKIAHSIFAKESPSFRGQGIERCGNPFSWPRMRTIYAGLILGLALGSAATVLVLKRSAVQEAQDRGFFASPEFIDRVELKMAKRETLDYLDKSRYLLLDFVQTDPSERGSGRNLLASKTARNLLAKKKYLNPQLGKYRMAQAKAICDQIELLFLDLAQISEDLPASELKKIQNLIEERRLLLKINLVKQELEREV